MELIPDLIRFLSRFDSGEINVIGFDAPWSTGKPWSGDPISDVGKIRHAVSEILRGPGAAIDHGAQTARQACSPS